MADAEQAYAVIGAGYGDEGKGLVTDALSSSATGVVRFNGGAQAGHTVITPEGRRHVFHHIGAGALSGAATHLSQFFVVNPILAIRELKELACLLNLTVDPRAKVTTPVDMAINQALEEKRGGGRHGSCGLGFGETIERHERGYPLTVHDISNRYSLLHGLKRIREEWIPMRCAELGIDLGSRFLGLLDDIEENFTIDCQRFCESFYLYADEERIGRGVQRVVFEGAQGLGLDQTHGAFPHVTRSNTGMKNVAALAKMAGIDNIRTVYVTRSYATRHGAGPLWRESEWPAGLHPVDPTNVPNEWQGSMRFAPLHLDQRRSWIAADMAEAAQAGVSVRAGLVVTCLDQFSETPPEEIAEGLGLPIWSCSHGPRRDNLSAFEWMDGHG